MNEIFLLKLGEIGLKGQNRKQFEGKLRQNVRRRMSKYGEFDVYIIQSTVYVEPKSPDCDLEGACTASKMASNFFSQGRHRHKDTAPKI